VLEGEGAHTAVGGEKTMMRYGDFVITPAWAWHDHGNQTKDPMMWLDGLDIPLVQFFDASFAENYAEDEQPIGRAVGDSLARYGANMLPVDHEKRGLNSPVFNYPYVRSREALEIMKRQNEWDPCHGLKMKYVNPADGGHAMPTMGTFLQLLPKGFVSARYRSTDATVFVCTEGKGKTRIGDQVISWGPRDIFVAPSWHWISHEPETEAVLFSYSDRPVHEKLGLFREQRGNA
jgi:gentisate 1,2-dioxygenase